MEKNLLGYFDAFTDEIDQAQDAETLAEVLQKYLEQIGFSHFEYKLTWSAQCEKKAGTLVLSNDEENEALFVVSNQMNPEEFTKHFSLKQHELFVMATYVYEKFSLMNSSFPIKTQSVH